MKINVTVILTSIAVMVVMCCVNIAWAAPNFLMTTWMSSSSSNANGDTLVYYMMSMQNLSSVDLYVYAYGGSLYTTGSASCEWANNIDSEVFNLAVPRGTTVTTLFPAHFKVLKAGSRTQFGDIATYPNTFYGNMYEPIVLINDEWRTEIARLYTDFRFTVGNDGIVLNALAPQTTSFTITPEPSALLAFLCGLGGVGSFVLQESKQPK